MSITSIALFVILALVLFSIALLYKSKIDGQISIFGMKIHLKASGDPKQKQVQGSHLPEVASEVNIHGEMKDVQIGKIAGRDINDHDGDGEKSQSSKSKVVISGNLKNVNLDQIAGRDIKSQSPKPQSPKQKSKSPKGN
jgi:hypothetical protein